MLDQNFFAKSDKIFKNLLDLANNELGSAGVNIEPSVIVAGSFPHLRTFI